MGNWVLVVGNHRNGISNDAELCRIDWKHHSTNVLVGGLYTIILTRSLPVAKKRTPRGDLIHLFFMQVILLNGLKLVGSAINNQQSVQS